MARLVVLGGGESGVGTAVLAKKQGYEVFLSDRGELQQKYRKVLSDSGIAFEEKQHTEAVILNADEVVKSPGIPDHVPLVVALRSQGTPVISEIEFAARYTNGKIIGITGSNGKTTTTSLLYHVLYRAGLDVAFGGNIGKSFAAQLAERDYAYWVLELSSFQLDGMFETQLDIAILLNITPDHLDRYDNDFERYVQSKFRICQNQTKENHFIYFADDPVIQKAMTQHDIPAQLHGFSLSTPQKEGAHLHEEEKVLININEELEMSIQELALQGKHNANNTMAAGIASRILEIRKEVVRESLSDFQNIEHRLEFVTRVSGVEYINDSKATNVNSTWYALESMSAPTIWIVGGVDKGNDYTELYDLVGDKVKAIIALGNDNGKILEAFSDKVEVIVEATNMREAVIAAYNNARKGDAVLLSPACASFDMFESYEDRGHQFKDAVRAL